MTRYSVQPRDLETNEEIHKENYRSPELRQKNNY